MEANQKLQPSDWAQKEVRIKFLGNYSAEAWLRQFRGTEHVWGRCRFSFDPDVRDYDWLVVYNDFPGNHQEEVLACPRENSLLVTMEPPTIKCYGRGYTRQFGHVLTSQPDWALPHRQRIYSQCALQWYYGYGKTRLLSFQQMTDEPALDKKHDLSTVCSTKRQRHTLHNRRYEFTQGVKARIPELEIFGHGVREMDDKAEALDSYRYHLAIENYIGAHHWTEKLADVFLGCALPFYCGCPNAADYFPEESFIQLDIKDIDGAAEIIRKAVRDKEYERRLPYILEARRLVMEEYNMFAVLAGIVRARGVECGSISLNERIQSRRLLRKKKPLVSASDVLEKSFLRLRQLIKADEA